MRAALSRRDLCREASDGLLQRFGAYEIYLAHLDHAETWIDRLRLLRAGPRLNLRVAVVGNRGNWRDSGIAEVRSLLAEAEERRMEAVAVACDAALGGLVSRLEALARGAADIRRVNGELSFHDLLVLARDLAAGDAGVRAELRCRYPYLLVDEFQDTDPLQLELVEVLARAPGDGVTGAAGGPGAGGTGTGGPGTGGPGAGGTVQLEAGRLFLVGDPKQAIYRFRGADLRVYEAARARLGATALELTTSFRAVPGIIEFVNATFAGLMGDRFAPLQVDRDSTGAPSPVRIVGRALENVSAAERRRAEGDAVTDVILSAIGDPGWIVADESDGALRTRAARRHRHPAPEPDRPRHPRGRPRRAAHRLPGRERLARLRLAGGPRSARARPRHRRPRQRDGSRRRASLSGLRVRRRRSARVPAQLAVRSALRP